MSTISVVLTTDKKTGVLTLTGEDGECVAFNLTKVEWLKVTEGLCARAVPQLVVPDPEGTRQLETWADRALKLTRGG